MNSVDDDMLYCGELASNAGRLANCRYCEFGGMPQCTCNVDTCIVHAFVKMHTQRNLGRVQHDFYKTAAMLYVYIWHRVCRL
jgi:hypothetical protein